jgi:hypothetical protein
MTAVLPSRSCDVAWRRLGPLLWVGRDGDEHIGMIERGRRFTPTDADGEVRGRYRTLEAAQAALTGRAPSAREPRSAPRPLVVATAAAALGLVALTGTALTLLG